MKISARVINNKETHKVSVATNHKEQSINIPPKANGYGSSLNGGELLFLALATCYCNDIYREAGKRGISVNKIEVEVEGEFGGEGEPAKNIIYNTKITSDSGNETIINLLKYVDAIAEIHNTLRTHTPVTLSRYEIINDVD
jgi:uncharacterized OsmC-like protein